MSSCKKSVDSTFKKLIYNVPKDKTNQISQLFKKLENHPNLIIDVELNSLEDAFVKIVRSEPE